MPETSPIYPSAQQVSYIGFNANQNVPQQNGVNRKQKPNVNETQDEDLQLPQVPSDSFDELNHRFNRLKKN